MEYVSLTSVLKIYIPVIILYIFNFTIILINTIRISNEKKPDFFPAIRIFK